MPNSCVVKYVHIKNVKRTKEERARRKSWRVKCWQVLNQIEVGLGPSRVSKVSRVFRPEALSFHRIWNCQWNMPKQSISLQN